MATQDHAKQWNLLHDDWRQAFDKARVARQKVTAGFVSSAAGRGAGPSEQDIAEADKLEAIADQKRQGMDDFLKQVFG